MVAYIIGLLSCSVYTADATKLSRFVVSRGVNVTSVINTKDHRFKLCCKGRNKQWRFLISWIHTAF